MRRALFVLVVASLAVSCSQDITRESESLEPQFSTAGPCPNAATRPGGVYQFWNCGGIVYLNVQSLTVADREVIEAAAESWNGSLNSRYPQLPRFTTDPTLLPRSHTVGVTKSGAASTTWCGTVSPKDPSRPTSMTVGTTASGNRCGAPFDVALHEMAHIVGFGGTWHSGSTLLQHCAVSLSTGTIDNVNKNGRPCQWEIETMLGVYGVRSNYPSGNFHIITHLFGPTGPTSLQVPNTATLGYTTYGFNGSNGTLCGRTSRQMCEAGEGNKAINGTMDWTSSRTDLATVTTPVAQTTVTARAQGTTTITAAPRATSTYSVAFGAAANRSLTITPPPPPPPVVSIVGNYTSSTNTIKSSQTCRFMAFPAFATSYAWSRQNSGSTTWQPVGTTREISQGTSVASFKLRVVVTNSGGTGSAILALTVTSNGVLCDGF
jgi:hypothetical protein